MSYTFFDRGMKNLLLSGEENVKKYIVVNKSSRIEIDEYYNYCLKRKRPYITIRKNKVYSNVDVDCITLPPEWDKYIIEKTKGYDEDFNLALERMGITKNGLNVQGLGSCFNIRVKTEYMEMFVEFIYNLYDIWIIEFLHDTRVKLRQKKKLLKEYRFVSEENKKLENEIELLNNILE